MTQKIFDQGSEWLRTTILSLFWQAELGAYFNWPTGVNGCLCVSWVLHHPQDEEKGGDTWRREVEAGGDQKGDPEDPDEGSSCCCWSFLPPASHVVSEESGWTAGPGPPQSPALPPSQLSSPSVRPHRDGTDESLWLTADSEDGGQTVTLSSSPALGVIPNDIPVLWS